MLNSPLGTRQREEVYPRTVTWRPEENVTDDYDHQVIMHNPGVPGIPDVPAPVNEPMYENERVDEVFDSASGSPSHTTSSISIDMVPDSPSMPPGHPFQEWRPQYIIPVLLLSSLDFGFIDRFLADEGNGDHEDDNDNDVVSYNGYDMRLRFPSPRGPRDGFFD